MTQLISERPPPGEPRPYRFPRFERVTLGSGLRLITCHLPGRPLGTARLILQAGPDYEPAGQEGVAVLAARSLTEGTKRRDAAGFADAVERLGADVDVDAGWDSFHARVVVPVARMEPALELLAEAVLEPTFPAHEVERLRAERLNEIAQERAHPAHRAHLAFLQTVYTPDSPYARSSAGTLESVSALGREAIEAHYRRFATPAGATLIVAGDLTGLELERTAERLFGGWSTPEPERPGLKAEEAITRTEILLVDRPGSVQSQIVAGHLGVPMVIPDYFPVAVMVTILGGMFTSRLNLKLREEKGYTYGARASFDFRRGPGPFSATAAVHTEVTPEAIADAVVELTKLREAGVTEDELVQARDYLVGVFPLAFETPEAIAQAIARLVVYGLPDDYYDTYRPAMQAVTGDNVWAAARDRLSPDRMAIVVVGDATALEKPVGELGLGPLTVVTEPPPAP